MTTSYKDYVSKRGSQNSEARRAARAEALLSLPLAALRECVGITQAAVAISLGKTQAAVSKFEARNDFLLSTLAEHVKALGGSLDIAIHIGNKAFRLVEKSDDDVAYFALEEKKAYRPCEIVQFVAEEKRKTGRPPHFVWPEAAMNEGNFNARTVVEHLNEANDNEIQSAAA